jgi:hypothetical protein
LEITEIGTRRRLAEALLRAEDEIVQTGLTDNALDVARRCAAEVAPTAWRTELRELIERLETSKQ